MALPPIGSEEVKLLYVETKDFTLTIKGRPVHPVAQGLGIVPENLQDHYVASHHIEGDYLVALCFDPLAEDQLAPYLPFAPVFACFYEQTPYEIVVERETERVISFYHRHQHLRNAVKPVGRRQTLTGMLNFQNDIGQTTLEVRVDGETALRVTIEVFPVKLQYKEDYLRLLHDINLEVYNLAYDFLRRTYLKAKLGSQRQSSLTEFYSVISYIFDRLVAAFERVKTSTHQEIVTSHTVVGPERVRRTDHAARRWLERHPDKLRLNNIGISIHGAAYLPERMLDARKRVSYNTYENRMLKWMLSRVLDKLSVLKKRYLSLKQPDPSFVRSIARMERMTRGMLTEGFLRECGQVTRVDGQSLVLQMAPGYREIFKYYLMLSKGLSIQGEIFELSVKDVATLYEYWCFLALGSILRRKYRLKRQNAIRVRGEGLAVTLDKGKAASLTFVNDKNGEEYVLAYNSRMHESPTVGQRPDNILTLRKAGSEVSYRYVFDAKYRINPALRGTPYYDLYGKPGPEEDDINTMHRYRDALVCRQRNGEYKRGTFGAVVLFPYGNEDDYSGKQDGLPHRFYQSIEQVGIGGLPFLPGHTRLVEDFLDDLILASPDTAHEQGGESEGTQQYYEERFAQRNVLVGVVGGKDHLSYHQQTRTYHIPANLFPKGFSHIEFVALYEPEGANEDGFRGVRSYGRVVDARLVRRGDISLPSKRQAADIEYVLFEVAEWHRIGPIVPAGYGVRNRIYTTLYLLKRARHLPELNLKSETEIRIWKELQRLEERVRIKLQSKMISDDTEVEGFEVDGKVISVQGIDILLDGARIAGVRELLTKPMMIVRRLRVTGE